MLTQLLYLFLIAYNPYLVLLNKKVINAPAMSIRAKSLIVSVVTHAFALRNS